MHTGEKQSGVAPAGWPVNRRPALKDEAGLERAWAQVDRDFESHLDVISAYLRQPSVSGTGEGIGACADMTAGLVELAGGTAEVVETAGHPAVVGNVDGPRPSLLRYGMYDVQPAEETAWTSPPFAAERRDIPGVGPSIVARAVPRFTPEGPTQYSNRSRRSFLT